MKTTNKFHWIMGVVAMLVSLYAQAYPGESIVLDPVTGNYKITYWDDTTEDGNGMDIQPRLMRTTFVPATKIIPVIRSKFRMWGASSVAYNYTLSNGASAKQSIVGLSLEQIGQIANERDFPPMTATATDIENVILSNMSAIDSPEDWSGNIYRVRGQSRVAWSLGDLRENGGVRPGRTVPGFGFTSPALPGISTARMKGIGAVFGYAGEGPAEDSAIKDELERLRKNDFVARPAAIPAIPVPVPFNAATLLDRIQTQMHTWIAMQLLDATFSSQLDRYLTAAADAYRHNQPKAGKEHIETLRRMLKKEHEDLGRDEEHESDNSQEKNDDKKAKMIDRLAARVLDFDLKYVLKRMGDD